MFARTTLVIAVGMFVLLDTSAIAQESANQTFAQKAAVSSQFEIEAGKLALDKGKDVSAKDYTQDMIEDHSKSLAELEEAAKGEGLHLLHELDADSTRKLQALREAPAADFDQAYLSTQVAAHEDAVQLLTAYSKYGPDGTLKSYAAHTVRTLRTHSLRIHGLTNK